MLPDAVASVSICADNICFAEGCTNAYTEEWCGPKNRLQMQPMAEQPIVTEGYNDNSMCGSWAHGNCHAWTDHASP